MSAMLDVSKALKYPGQAYAFAVAPEIEEMEVLGDPVTFEEIVVKGEYFGADGRVRVRGKAAAQLNSRCCRCLEPVRVPITAEIDAEFAREEDPDDPDLYLFEGSKADLTNAARDALLLEMPYRVLCSEDCKGLCPGCGKNLNLGPCTCQEDATAANPFSALKAIVQNNEEV